MQSSVQEELKQCVAIEPDLKKPGSLPHNKPAAKLSIQPQGGKLRTITALKKNESIVHHKLCDSAASNTNSSLQKQMKDKADTCQGRDALDESGWTEVKRKCIRTSLSRTRRGYAGEGSTQLEVSKWLRRIRLFYVKQGTTDDQVKSHLKSITGSDAITVEILKSRGPRPSFKLIEPSTLLNLVMAPESWPLNVCVEPWSQPFRHRDEKQML